MKHFLFTRFNLPIQRKSGRKLFPGRSLIKSKENRLNPEWLEMRLKLFYRFCQPSVMAQTTKNFTWVVLAHKDTPLQILQRLEGEVVLTDEPDWKATQNYLKENTNGGEFIISSNLDSDDAISKNFIATIQNAFSGSREFINIPEGYLLDIYNQVYVGKDDAYQNPFRSLVESTDLLGVYYVSHGLSSKVAPVKQVTGAKWLQVIHGDNLSNRFKKCGADKPRPFYQIENQFS